MPERENKSPGGGNAELSNLPWVPVRCQMADTFVGHPARGAVAHCRHRDHATNLRVFLKGFGWRRVTHLGGGTFAIELVTLSNGRRHLIRFIGHSDGKVIVPNEPITIPQGQLLDVTVSPVAAEPREGAGLASLLRLAREAEALDSGLPTDLAAQHDHYLYGTPKR